MDPRVIEAGRLPLAVKDSSLLMGQVYERKRKAGKTHFPAGKIFDAKEMEAAIDSALTKYDSLEAYFVQDKMKAIISLVVEEVEHDMMPTLSSDKDAEVARKEIKTTVCKYVGVRYGQWKMNKS